LLIVGEFSEYNEVTMRESGFMRFENLDIINTGITVTEDV